VALDLAAMPPKERKDAISPRWTLKKFVAWLKEKHQIYCSRETVRTALKILGFSWKKARKALNKASPFSRQCFVKQLGVELKKSTQGKHCLIYIDEAHIHLDTDEGYGWSILGKRFWVSSSSPGLKKVSLYGLYYYNLGQVKILPYERANGENTVDMLKQIKEEHPDQAITIIWDGASYHRSLLVREAAQELEITLLPLPAYSPDFMPVEHLWAWLREEVTYHACYETQEQLIRQVELFQQQINAKPIEMADRLWTKTSLDPSEERLRVSN
jgi:transposase